MNEISESQFLSLAAWKVVYLVEIFSVQSAWHVRVNGTHWLGRNVNCPQPFGNIERTLMYLHEVGCEHVMIHLKRLQELPGA